MRPAALETPGADLVDRTDDRAEREAAVGTDRARRGGRAAQVLEHALGITGVQHLGPEDHRGLQAGRGFASITYQVIQWANFTQTFASAVASKTNPAVKPGGGAGLQFEDQGGIEYLDEMCATWKENGLYEDFLPGLIDTLKVEKGYAAVPYNLDMRIIWVNQALMEEAGGKVPTDWRSTWTRPQP